MNRFAKAEQSRSFQGLATQHLVITLGFHLNGRSVRQFVAKEFKIESLSAVNLKEIQSKKQMKVNAKQVKNPKAREIVTVLKNVLLNGLQVHGLNAPKNVVVVFETAK